MAGRLPAGRSRSRRAGTTGWSRRTCIATSGKPGTTRRTRSASAASGAQSPGCWFAPASGWTRSSPNPRRTPKRPATACVAGRFASCCLPLYGGRCLALDEVALEDDEEDRDGHRRDDGDRHQRRLVRVIRLLEHRETQRQREQVGAAAADEDQRLEEGVPASLEGEDRQRRDRRNRVRHDDLREDAPPIRAVDP